MTIQEIGIYLKKHNFLVFRYRSGYYSLVRHRSLFRTRYCLIATDALSEQRNSLEELCEQVYICEGTLLADAIGHMEIPKWDDPSFETYEAVRHNAIVHRNEIHFQYNQRYYWITHTPDGVAHFIDDLGNTQDFNSCRDLFAYARINGNTLLDIWCDVIVDAC